MDTRRLMPFFFFIEYCKQGRKIARLMSSFSFFFLRLLFLASIVNEAIITATTRNAERVGIDDFEAVLLNYKISRGKCMRVIAPS